ncbi:MAG TPA: DUF1844 domain-containing protein [Syntrophobacteraceae bacterium]|nr:DUF1844 domain-containing protein [Syntrophobacteraceae bacterium]
MNQEPEDQGFVFKDRRKISLDETSEEPAAATSTGEPSPTGEPDRESQAAAAEPSRKTDSSRHSTVLPEVNFSTFVFSLSSSALVHLGEIPEPVSNQMQQDLGLAKQIIDTLGMIADKTSGNLDADEERLIKGILYDLRMRFVQKSK